MKPDETQELDVVELEEPIEPPKPKKPKKHKGTVEAVVVSSPWKILGQLRVVVKARGKRKWLPVKLLQKSYTMKTEDFENLEDA